MGGATTTPATIPATMPALRYDGPGAVTLVELPVPEPGPGQVLVEISMCGMCGTDVHSYKEAGVLAPGTVFGHESVGRVARLGAEVTCVAVGDRVAIGAPGACPEGCWYCRTGRSTLCPHAFARTPGIGPGTQGAYARYVLAAYPEHQLIAVPDGVTDEQAVMFDVFATAWHGLRRSSFRPGANVAVVGIGAIGLSMVQLLRASGAGRLVALNRSAKKRELALRHGADVAIDPSAEPDLPARLRAECGGTGPDVVFECAGSAATIGAAVAVVRPGGEVVVVGTTPESLSTVTGIQVQLFEIDLKGSFAYDEDEIRTVFRFMERGDVRTDEMLERRVPLAQSATAMAELAASSAPVRWVVVP